MCKRFIAISQRVGRTNEALHLVAGGAAPVGGTDVPASCA
jgi:hypothetical protein